MPDWKEEIKHRLVRLKLDLTREAEIVEELAQHLEDRYAELLIGGADRDEARRVVIEELSDGQLLARELRRVQRPVNAEPVVWGTRRRNLMADLWLDLRYAMRMLHRNPGFTFVAVLTLALGIGANTAIFSVVNAVLLHPLPYQDPDRLVVLWTDDATRDIHEAGTSYPTLSDWRSASQLFAEMAIWAGNPLTLTGDSPERVAGQFVSANLFPMLGVQPALGRTFSPEEEQQREQVVVLAYSLWQRRFGSDPSVLGKTLEVDTQSGEGVRHLQVIGVMPDGFYFPTKEVQLWQPATLLGLGGKPQVYERRWTDRFADAWRVVGKLKPGVTVREAQAELNAVGLNLARTYPTTNPNFAGFGVSVVPMLEQITGKNLQVSLWVLLGAVVFVLLIACANVANLLLARGASRERELAIRAALGAGRLRLLRQLLTESVLLAFGAGLLGLGLAAVGIRTLAASNLSGIARLDEIEMNSSVMLFTVGLSLIAGILFGLAPAWRMSQQNPNGALKEGGARSAGGLRPRQTRGLLVVAECALAVTLLTGAGLLIRSFLLVQSVDPGFDSKGVLLVRISLPIPASRQWRQAEWATWHEITERIGALQGVASVGAVENLLIASNPEGTISVEGRPRIDGQENVQVNSEDVTPGLFRTLGVPLLRGRFFTYQEQNAPLAIVNEALARRFFAGVDPIGKRFKNYGTSYEIVGVVGDMHRQGLERQPVPEFFIPSSEPTMDMVVRAASPTSTLEAAVRNEIRSVYQSAMVLKVTSLEQTIDDLSAQRRFQTWLLALFALVALLLASVGIFGVTHYAVAQRTSEIGIRIALGAQRSAVLRLVIVQGMKVAAIGVGIGLIAALWLTRILVHLLFGVSAHDLVTFTGVALVLLVAAFVACYLPARKATKVDPLVALRSE